MPRRQPDIHSCSYYCDRPECIKAQRDELRQRVADLEKQTEEINAARIYLREQKRILTQLSEGAEREQQLRQLVAESGAKVRDLQTELAECVQRHSECYEILVVKERRLRVWKESYEVAEIQYREQLAACEKDRYELRQTVATLNEALTITSQANARLKKQYDAALVKRLDAIDAAIDAGMKGQE
jgi:chromosome segregation ATPase